MYLLFLEYKKLIFQISVRWEIFLVSTYTQY